MTINVGGFTMYCFKRTLVLTSVLLLSLTAIVSFVHAQKVEPIQIGVENVADNVFMLTDNRYYGNVGVFTGEDGILIIDTKTAECTEKMIAAIAEISKEPIRFAINTHWHFDHAGGNENMGKAGVTLIAHKNVHTRMSTEQHIEFFDMTFPPSLEEALPLITFTQDMTLHFNGDDLYVFHVQPGHTDGDVIVYFRNANIMHMGDLYTAGFYPYIGISSGGSLNGIIQVINHVLPMIDDTTKLIPGHGPVSNKMELQAYLAMLITIKDRIRQQIDAGKTLEDVLAAKPTQEFDAEWGQGFIKPEQFTELVYRDLSKEQK